MIRHLIAIVAAMTGVPPYEITGHCRARHVIEARHLALWLAVTVLGKSHYAVGLDMGVNHATVLAARKRVDQLRERDTRWLALTEGARRQLEAKRLEVRTALQEAGKRFAAGARP